MVNRRSINILGVMGNDYKLNLQHIPSKRDIFYTSGIFCSRDGYDKALIVVGGGRYGPSSLNECYINYGAKNIPKPPQNHLRGTFVLKFDKNTICGF